MYSVVLMMALSGSAETPEFGGRGRCHGCAGGGCHGGYGCAGGGCHGGCEGGYPVPPPKTGDPKVMPKKTEGPSPATIIVSLPANARLLIDGNSTSSTSARRIFTSPTLQPGADYVYTLRAEIIRDGQTVV